MRLLGVGRGKRWKGCEVSQSTIQENRHHMRGWRFGRPIGNGFVLENFLTQPKIRTWGISTMRLFIVFGFIAQIRSLTNTNYYGSSASYPSSILY